MLSSQSHSLCTGPRHSPANARSQLNGPGLDLFRLNIPLACVRNVDHLQHLCRDLCRNPGVLCKRGCYQICNHYQPRPRVTCALVRALKALSCAGLIAMGSYELLPCNSLISRAARATNQKVGSSNLSGRASDS
jgi:hypothetical protein